MGERVSVGECCPNPPCGEYGTVGGGNLIRYGKSGAGHQRVRWTCCRGTFKERRGTLLDNRKTPEADLPACLARLAAGTRLSSISRTQGLKEDTILAWVREAALLKGHRIGPAQIDGLWTDVGRKGQKTKRDHRTMKGNMGAVR